MAATSGMVAVTLLAWSLTPGSTRAEKQGGSQTAATAQSSPEVLANAQMRVAPPPAHVPLGAKPSEAMAPSERDAPQAAQIVASIGGDRHGVVDAAFRTEVRIREHVAENAKDKPTHALLSHDAFFAPNPGPQGPPVAAGNYGPVTPQSPGPQGSPVAAGNYGPVTPQYPGPQGSPVAAGNYGPVTPQYPGPQQPTSYGPMAPQYPGPQGSPVAAGDYGPVASQYPGPQRPTSYGPMAPQYPGPQGPPVASGDYGPVAPQYSGPQRPTSYGPVAPQYPGPQPPAPAGLSSNGEFRPQMPGPVTALPNPDANRTSPNWRVQPPSVPRLPAGTDIDRQRTAAAGLAAVSQQPATPSFPPPSVSGRARPPMADSGVSVRNAPPYESGPERQPNAAVAQSAAGPTALAPGRPRAAGGNDPAASRFDEMFRDSDARPRQFAAQRPPFAAQQPPFVAQQPPAVMAPDLPQFASAFPLVRHRAAATVEPSQGSPSPGALGDAAGPNAGPSDIGPRNVAARGPASVVGGLSVTRMGPEGDFGVGFGQPGLGQPGFGQPGFGQPGFGQPGLGQPGFGQPGLGRAKFEVGLPVEMPVASQPSGSEGHPAVWAPQRDAQSVASIVAQTPQTPGFAGSGSIGSGVVPGPEGETHTPQFRVAIDGGRATAVQKGLSPEIGFVGAGNRQRGDVGNGVGLQARRETGRWAAVGAGPGAAVSPDSDPPEPEGEAVIASDDPEPSANDSLARHNGRAGRPASSSAADDSRASPRNDAAPAQSYLAPLEATPGPSLGYASPTGSGAAGSNRFAGVGVGQPRRDSRAVQTPLGYPIYPQGALPTAPATARGGSYDPMPRR